MSTTLTIEGELAERLEPYRSHLDEIVGLGINAWRSRGEGFAGLHEVLQKLASLPDPAEVLALRPSPALQERIDTLLEKNRTSGLSEPERHEWDRIAYVEHLVRMAKLNAARKLRQTAP
jgi:hypothetical protein